MPVPELVISSVGFPPASVRGVKQTLTPIAEISQTARTVNGELVDLSDAVFKMYASTISCADMDVPSFIWPGAEVTVDCVAELSYLTYDGSPTRPVVDDREDGDFTIYRPRLIMRVISWSIDHDEWGRVISWTINLEESRVEEVTT